MAADEDHRRCGDRTGGMKVLLRICQIKDRGHEFRIFRKYAFDPVLVFFK